MSFSFFMHAGFAGILRQFPSIAQNYFDSHGDIKLINAGKHKFCYNNKRYNCSKLESKRSSPNWELVRLVEYHRKPGSVDFSS